VRVNRTQIIDPGINDSRSVGCPEGGLLISGMCTHEPYTSGADLTLQQSGTGDNLQSWNCWFRNNSASPVTIKVTAICLMPGT
jgi:hypothetical protein